MRTFISDNPGRFTTAVTGLIASAITLAVAFGVHITPDQTVAILAFITALGAILGLVASNASVPKTPSASTPNLVQTPPPGTVLVTTQAAQAKSAVPAGSVIAGPTP